MKFVFFPNETMKITIFAEIFKIQGAKASPVPPPTAMIVGLRENAHILSPKKVRNSRHNSWCRRKINDKF